jgi:hypothetical protein
MSKDIRIDVNEINEDNIELLINDIGVSSSDNENILKNIITKKLYKRIREENKLQYEYQVNKIFNSIKNRDHINRDEINDEVNIYFNRNKLKKILISTDSILFTKRRNVQVNFMEYIKNSKNQINLENKSENEIIDILLNTIENYSKTQCETPNEILSKIPSKTSNKSFIYLILFYMIFISVAVYLIVKHIMDINNIYNSAKFIEKTKKP